MNQSIAALTTRTGYYSDMQAHYAAEIAADFMSIGRCAVQIGRSVTEIDWADFLLFVDEGGLWERLGADRDDLFATFCNDWAGHRATYMSDDE